jgi:hypothetical protein
MTLAPSRLISMELEMCSEFVNSSLGGANELRNYSNITEK